MPAQVAMSRSHQRPSRDPPGRWSALVSLVRSFLAPLERFLAIEAASGAVLFTAAVVALLWANSPWRQTYEALWQVKLGATLGAWSFERDLGFWINDGLMTVFFFVVGLEIKRELHHGELSQLRRAALPVAAAVGGMILPAVIFLLLNHGRPSVNGWGTPMATDIAFAVGVLALLGKRVPPPLRMLLLALAVIDDVGAIVVIAIFYSAGLTASGLLIAGAGVLGVVVLTRLGARSPWAYLPAAMVIWAGAYASGVHPTLAGVVLGLLTPSASTDGTSMSPVDRLEHALHGWVAFGVMPIFAFANAGVPLGGATFDGDGLRIVFGIVLGLCVGKPLGVVGLSWLATRAGLASLPAGVGWQQVVVVGLAAGVGFTMAIFIAELAFPPGPALQTAKLGVLAGSALAGVVAVWAGRILLPAPVAPDA